MNEVEAKSHPRGRDFDQMERSYSTSENWPKLVDLYLESAASSADKKVAVQRLLKAGTILRDKLRQTTEAKSCFDKSVDIFTGWIHASQVDVHKSDLLCDLAKIYLEVIRDREKAIESYVRAFELDPAKTHLMNILGDIYSEKEGWSDVVQKFRREVAGANAPELKARYLGEIAEVYSFILNKPEEAISTYRQLLELDPDHMQAFEALESLLIKERRWDHLASLYEEMRLKKRSADDAISILTKLGLIYRDKLRDPWRAIGVYQEILALQPGNFRISAKLEELRGDKEIWNKAYSQIDASLESLAVPAEKVPILLRKAEIAATYLEDPAGALGTLQRILEIDPAHTEAISKAVLLWERQSRWEEITHCLERAAGVVQDRQKSAEYWKRAASISLRHLNDPPRGIAAFEALHALAPDDTQMCIELATLYENQQMWGPLEKLLVESMAPLPADTKVPWLLRLANLREDRLSAIEGATQAYEEILHLDPLHREALDALERLYPALRKWPDLANLHLRRAESSVLPQEKSGHHIHAGQVFEEKLADLRSAAKAYEDALDAATDPLTLAAKVERIYFTERRWEELAALYEKLLSLPRSGESEIHFQSKLAELRELRFQDLEGAAKCWRRVVELRPRDRNASAQLKRICEAVGDWPSLANLYEQEALDAAESSERILPLSKAAQIAETRLEDPRRAESLYRKIFEIDRQDRSACDYLRSAYRESGRFEDLTGILTAQLEITEEPRLKGALHAEMGAIAEEHLQDEARALQHYEIAASLDPSSETSLKALSRYYRKHQQWNELVRTLRTELGQGTERIRAAGIAIDIARIYRRELKNPSEAIEYYRRSLDLAHQSETLTELAETYHQAGRSSEALPIMEKLFELSSETRQKALLALRIGDAYDQVGNLGEAGVWYERALEDAPQNATLPLKRLGEIYEAAERWGDLKRCYDRLLSYAEGTEAAGIYVKLGTLYESRLDDPEEALVAYQLAHELDPNLVEPLTSMRRLLAARQNWGEYLRVAEAETPLIQDPSTRIALLYETAELWRNQFLQVDRATATLEKILAIHPSHEDALIRLSHLKEEQHRFDAALTDARKALGLVKDPSKRMALLERIGRIERRPGGHTKEALNAFREILALEPTHKTAQEEMALLCAQEGDWKGHVSALQLMLESEKDPHRTVDLLLKMADTWCGPLGSRSNAVQVLTAALHLEPANPRALTMLGELTDTVEAWNAATHRLSEHPALEEDGRAAIAVSVARVHAKRFKRHDLAIAGLKNALDRCGPREEILTSLSEYYEASGETVALADILLIVARQNQNTAARRPAFLRVAKLWADQLDNPRQAASVLEEAMEGDFRQNDLYDAMLQYRLRSGDWGEAAKQLGSALEEIPMESQRGESLLLQLTDLLAERLHQPEEALSWLSKLLDKVPTHRTALESCCHLLEQRGDYAGLSRRLESLLPLVSREETLSVRTRLARLYEERLGQSDRAVKQYEAIYALQPKDDASLEQLERLHSVRKDPQSRIKVLQQRAQLAITPSAASELFQRLAHTWLHDLGDQERATFFLERAYEKSPHLPLLDNLIELYRAQKRHAELAEAIRKRAAASTPAKAVADHLELAEIFRTHLANPIASLEQLEKVLDILPLQPEALRQAAEIHLQNENYRAYASSLMRLAEISESPETRVQHLLSLARVQAKHLGARYDAIETCRTILTLEPRHSEALANLRTLYGEDARWDELAEVLRRIASETGAAESRALLEELADVELTRCHDPVRAAVTLERLRAQAPEDIENLHRLQNIYAQLRRPHDLVQSLAAELNLHFSPERDIEVLEKLGTLYSDALANPSLAIETWEILLKLVPTHLGALSHLESLYRQAARPNDAITLLERRAELTSDMRERAVLLESLAEELLRNPDGIDRAIRTYRTLSEIPGQRLPALERTAALFERSSRWAELSETWRALADHVSDPSRRVLVLAKLGILLQERLNDPKGAEEIFRNILTIFPHHPEAVLRLRTMFRTGERWPEAESFLHAELEGTSTPIQRAPLLRELVSLYQGPLNDPDRSQPFLEELAHISPHDRDVVASLANTYFQREEWDKALPLLERLAKFGGSHKDNSRLGNLFYRLGVVCRQLGRLEESALHFQQSFSHDPSHADSSRALADLFFNMGQWENALKMLRFVVQKGGGADDAYIERNYYRILQTLERLERPEEAVSLFEEARDRLKNHIGVIKLAARMYLSMERWKEAAVCLEILVRDAGPGAETIQARFELARVEALRLGRSTRGRELLAKVLSEDPLHKDALELNALLCENEREWPLAVQSLEQLVELEKNPERLAAFFYRLGHIQDREIGDLRKAREAYVHSIEVGAGKQDAVEALKALVRTEADWKELDTLYRERSSFFQKKGDAGAAAQFEIARGQLCAEHRNDKKAASSAFEEAARLDPSSPEAPLAVARLIFADETKAAQALRWYEKSLHLGAAKDPSILAEAARAAARAGEELKSSLFQTLRENSRPANDSALQKALIALDLENPATFRHICPATLFTPGGLLFIQEAGILVRLLQPSPRPDSMLDSTEMLPKETTASVQEFARRFAIPMKSIKLWYSDNNSLVESDIAPDPTIGVGPHFYRQSAEIQRCLLGLHMARLRLGVPLLNRLAAAKGDLFLKSLSRVIAGGPSQSEDTLTMVDALSSSLSKKDRKHLGILLSSGTFSEIPVDTLTRDFLEATSRIAVYLTGDVVNSLEASALTDPASREQLMAFFLSPLFIQSLERSPGTHK